MTYNDFQLLPEKQPDITIIQIGYKYLEGQFLIDQKTEKTVGDLVTYYEVIDIKLPDKLLIIPRYETLTP